MANATSVRILDLCQGAFPGSSDDCNKFLKAVANVLFSPDPFLPAANADTIVAAMRASSDWATLGMSHADAIRDAKSGLFVVAGMTSAELGDSHGHLAVVVGDDGLPSGTVVVPVCYAGSLKASARVQRRRVSETFGAANARESRISYFSRAPNA